MKIVKNLLYNGSLQISGILLNLILLPYIARVLGPSLLGINSFGQTISGYFVLLGNLGIVIYGSKSIAELRDYPVEKQQKFSECVTFQLFCNSIAILLYNIWVILQSANNDIYLLFNIILLTSMTDLSWAYTGMERFDLVAIRNITIKIVGTLLVFLFVKNEQDLFLFIILQQGVLFISNIIFWIQLKKIGLQIKLVSIKNSLSKTLKSSLILFVPSIFTSIYLSLNKVMLGYLSTLESVAIYDYPNRLIRIAITLVGVIGTVMLPRLSYLNHSERKDEYVIKIQQMFYGSMLCSIPIVFLFILNAIPLCQLFFTKSFVGAENIILIVSPSIMLSGLCLYIIYISMNSIKPLLQGVIAGSLLNIALNIIFIPQWNALGAALSNIATEIIVHIILLYNLRKIISIRWILSSILPIIIVSLISFLLLRNLRIKNEIMQISVSSISFLLIYILIITITQKKKIENIFLNGKNMFSFIRNYIQ